MPQMSQVLRERAIGTLTAGMSTRAVACELNVNFSAHINQTLSKVISFFCLMKILLLLLFIIICSVLFYLITVPEYHFSKFRSHLINIDYRYRHINYNNITLCLPFFPLCLPFVNGARALLNSY